MLHKIEQFGKNNSILDVLLGFEFFPDAFLTIFLWSVIGHMKIFVEPFDRFATQVV